MTDAERERAVDREATKIAKKIKGGKQSNKRPRLEGEIERKKQLAVIYRLAGYRDSAISASIGEDTATVCRWFAETEVTKYYTYLLENLHNGGIKFLRHLTMKALAALEEILDEEKDNGIRLSAIKEILDRGGYPKETRKETNIHATGETKTTFGSLPEISALRELPVEMQEEAAQMIDKLQDMLNGGKSE